MAISAKTIRSSKVTYEDNSGLESIESQLVYMNDGVRVCTQACACCWDKPIPPTYEEQVEYLAKRSSTGHTSIFEHSNFVILLKLSKIVHMSEVQYALMMLADSRYLNTRITFYKANGNIARAYILIGGSYRGYDELFRASRYPNNPVMKAIAKVMYQYLDARLFSYLCENNILNADSFHGVEPDPISRFVSPFHEEGLYEDDKIKIVSADSPKQIYKNVCDLIGGEAFTPAECDPMGTITILFKNMSRTGTHQLVRHRNAITQESQRYVDYSNAAFIDPVKFKPDKYDVNKKYTVHFGGQEFQFTSEELGEEICKIYQDMLGQGLMKEDARAFLPGNVACRKIYMTFTYSSYMKFLELRCHPAAQAEIRSFAIDCRDASTSIFEQLANEFEAKENAVDEILVDKEVLLKEVIKNDPELQEEPTKE